MYAEKNNSLLFDIVLKPWKQKYDYSTLKSCSAGKEASVNNLTITMDEKVSWKLNSSFSENEMENEKWSLVRMFSKKTLEYYSISKRS